MRRAAAIAAVVAACVLAALALGANGGDGGGKTYKIVLDNAFGLADGGDFKIAGVKAGKTGDMHWRGRRTAWPSWRPRSPSRARPTCARTRICEVRPQSFIGEYFVDCQPGTSPQRLPDGGRVPVSRPARRSGSTSSTTSCAGPTASACA